MGEPFDKLCNVSQAAGWGHVRSVLVWSAVAAHPARRSRPTGRDHNKRPRRGQDRLKAPPLLPLSEDDSLHPMTPTPDSPRCDQPCALTCAEVCPLHAPAALPPIDLDDALQRFDREAIRGVCDTGRYKMPYYVWGEGPPLVFVHGAMDSSRAWVMPISRLSAHFRCVAYDLPNGRDDGARLGRHTHADLVADFFALLDHLDLARSYVFASSFGSTIALPALRERPERLPRAVLQGGLALRPLRRLERFLAAWDGSCRARPAGCRCARR